MGTRLGIIVVNFASSALLERNLVVVQGDVGGDALVVVVDNHSTHDEAESVRRLAVTHSWHAILSDDNPGFGAAVNLGVRDAVERGCTDLLILNPDATIDARSVNELRAVVAEDRMTLACPTITAPDGSVWFAGAALSLQDGSILSARRRQDWEATSAVPWLTGACLLASAELWHAVGGFEPTYFLYWEDVDLSRRVADVGGRLAHVEAARAIHDEGGTQHDARAGRGKSPTYYYFNTRNRLLFASRHLDEAGMRRWRDGRWAAAREILLRGGRRQFLRPLAPLRAAWRGTRDGTRIVDAALADAPRTQPTTSMPRVRGR
jgi:GT2 family glycosyltransferase